MSYICPQCGQRIDDDKPCGCGARKDMTPDEMMKKAEQDYLDAFVEHAKCMFAVDDWTKHNPEKHVIDNGPVWTAYEAARIAMDRYGVAYLRARLGDGPADRMWKIMKEDER